MTCVSLSLRGVAQLGSAPLWGSGGRGFKSRRSDLICLTLMETPSGKPSVIKFVQLQ